MVRRMAYFPVELRRLATSHRASLERSLAPGAPIGMTLFSHGADSAGLAPVECCRSAVRRARREGRVAGSHALEGER
jgi:hypothetical protein